MPSKEGPDHGRAWAVAFAVCVINMVISGTVRVSGMFYKEVIEVYEVSREQASQPFTIRYTIRALLGPLVGILAHRYGVRAVTLFGGVAASSGITLCSVANSLPLITLFWGVFYGVGFSFGSTVHLVVLNQYFDKHRATAMGLAESGSSIGSLIFPELIEKLLFEYRLSGTFLILGGMLLHVLPSAILLRSPPWLNQNGKIGNTREQDSDEPLRMNQNDPENNSEDGVNITNASETNRRASGENIKRGWLEDVKNCIMLFTNPIYVLTNFSVAVFAFVAITLLAIIVDYGVDKGFPKSHGKYLIIAFAMGELIGHVGFGWVTDRKFLNLHTFVTVNLMVQGITVACIAQANSMASFTCLIIIFSIAVGSLLVLFPVLVYKYVSKSKQALAMGSLRFLSGIFSFAIPATVGYFRDQLGSYDGYCYTCAGICLVLAAIWAMEPILKKFVPREATENYEIWH